MALQSSGAISLDDIHVEAGGSSGTQAGINDSDIRLLINKSSASQMAFNEWYGASSYTGSTTEIAIGDQFVFTSCMMHGSHGPWNDMTSPYYSQYYNSNFTNNIYGQVYAGVQRWRFPTAGTYDFTLVGGWAGHNINQSPTSGGIGSGSSDFYTSKSGFNWSNNMNYSFFPYTNSHLYGLPGKLTVRRDIPQNQIISFIVGQAGLSGAYYSTSNVCAAGAGATVVALTNTTTSPTGDAWHWARNWYNYDGIAAVAIAGGGGANRNNSGGFSTNRNSPLQINGNPGGNAAGGTGGYGGSDSYSGYYDSTSGAGWRGDGSNHGDTRGVNIQALGGAAQAIFDSTYPAQGGLSGAEYPQPYRYNYYSRPHLYLEIDTSTHLVTGGGTRDGSNYGDSINVSQSQFVNWHNASSTAKVNNPFTYINSGGGSVRFPVSSSCIGGFGGGSVGNWGGCGAGGGWSGGGEGTNQSYGGGGSSYYTSGWTFQSFSNPHSNSIDNDMDMSDNSLKIQCRYLTGSTNKIQIHKGVYRGNGHILVKRVA